MAFEFQYLGEHHQLEFVNWLLSIKVNNAEDLNVPPSLCFPYPPTSINDTK
jgi:hypothetical protein